MRFYRGDGKMGNGVIVDDNRALYFFDEPVAKARSQYNANFRLGDAVTLDVANRLVDLVEHSCVVSKIAKGESKSNIVFFDKKRQWLKPAELFIVYLRYTINTHGCHPQRRIQQKGK